MRAITLHDPWGWAICWVGKWIENRTWAPPAELLGQQIAIHVGKTLEEDSTRMIAERFGVAPRNWFLPDDWRRDEPRREGFLVPSAVVCVATLAGYVRHGSDAGAAIAPGARLRMTSGRIVDDPREILRLAAISPWFVGPVGWILADRVALPEPVPCSGKQGLWSLPPQAEDRVRALVSGVGGER